MTISLRQGTQQVQRQALLKAASVVLLVSALPTATADDCWIDRYGNRRCRLPLGARIAIAVCSILFFIFVLLALGLYRRRRLQRTNMAYVTAQQQQQPTPYGTQYGNQYQEGYAPYPPNAPAYGEGAQYQQQYPPPGQDYYNQQAPQGAYAPPYGPPPGAQQGANYAGYNAPRSPPPAKV